MIKYNKGDKVTLCAALKNEYGKPEVTAIAGEVFTVIPTDAHLQCLIIYGNTATGRNVRTVTYSDDKSLTLISSSQSAIV